MNMKGKKELNETVSEINNTKEEELEIKEKVAQELKDGMDKAVKVSQQIRQRVNVKPKSDFINTMKDAENELKEAVAFIERAEQEPKLFLEESHEHIGKTKDIVFSIMNHWKRGEKQIKGYDFQAYLAAASNRYFQEWLKTNNITESFEIEVRNPQQFPSIFAVYQNGTELMQLNILEKWYGIRQRKSTEEEVVTEYHQELTRVDNDIVTQMEKLSLAKERRDHPLQYYKGFKNFFAWLFLNKKKLHESFEKLVKNEESKLQQYKESKERIVQYHPITLKNLAEKRVSIEKIEPFFKEMNYTLNEIQSRLY